MTDEQARRLALLHANLMDEWQTLCRAAARRTDPEAEVLRDQADDARTLADAVAAALVACPVPVTIPDGNQISLLSLGGNA